ncbi:glycosyl hydrolase 53 family protein [Paenibacillaceae bacterium WGS1546]|uniref:glycosyl hydrolase 53 family protein n=1 Tax=Cohnella sp. WGS1546 TaxID=3366810 RepID=UPI00372D7D45
MLAIAVAGLAISAGISFPRETRAAPVNLVANPGFEDSGDALIGWDYAGTEGAWSISDSNVHSGTRSVNYYNDDPYSFRLSQTFTGLPDGEYVLKAWAGGGEREQTERQMYIETGGAITETPIARTAVWNAWEPYSIGPVAVTDGQATIGFEVVDAQGGEWGYFDDVEFYKIEHAPVWSEAKSLTASEVGATSLKLEWAGVENESGVTGYRVFVNGELLKATESTSTHVEDLLPETTYLFKVEAGNAAGLWSADGPETTATTAAATATAPVWSETASLSVSSLTSRGAVLEWTGASDAVGVTRYRIYRNGVAIATLPSDANSFHVADLSPGVSYTFKVEAGNAAGLWSASGPSSAVTTPSTAAETFIKGADISTLQAIEDAGGKYYDGGLERDLLDILKERGVNYIRLRLWNDPVLADGYNDRARTVETAKRVKAAGLKLLLDFHYSDFWADPGKQEKPAAWQNLSFAELGAAVYDYTAEVLTQLKAENAYPDMVQIGNEINPGFLLPDGSTSNYDKLTQLLGRGIQAVRDTTPAGQETKIMIHLAEGGNNAIFRGFFDQLEARNVDYDVIGLSFYPYWHGTYQHLKSNLNDLAVRYGKELVVVETAHPHTLEDGDGWPNIAGAAEADKAGFPATPAGQAEALELILNTVAQTVNGKGAGVFYWEPAWIPVPKDDNGDYRAGWKTKEGNAWDNQAMFDFGGNALPSLDAFRFDPNRPPAKRAIRAMPLEGLTVTANEAAQAVAAKLPATAGILYNEGSIEQAAVAWPSIDPDRLSRVGKFSLTGTVSGTELRAQIEITVTAYKNEVLNPGFEEELASWNVSGDSAAAKVVTNEGNAHSGQRALNYWYGSDYAFRLSQPIEGLSDGRYTLKARISGEDPADQPSTIRLFAETEQGKRLSEPVVNTGWNRWAAHVIDGIEVTDGRAVIGAEVDAYAGAWGYLDDFEFYRQVSVPEWTSAAKLEASERTASSVKLVWTGLANPEAAAGYKIYQDDALIGTAAGTSKVVAGLKPNTRYEFKVEATEDSAIWTSDGPSVAVTTLSATNGGSGSPGGGGAGSGGSSEEQTEEHIFLPEPDRLTEPKDGRIAIGLPTGTTEIRLSAEALAALGASSLLLEGDGISLTLPAALLARMNEQVRANRGYASIRMPAVAAFDERIAQAASKLGMTVTASGGGFDIGIALVAADGRATTPSRFAEPVELRVRLPQGADAGKAGTYRLTEAGGLEFVGAATGPAGTATVGIDRPGAYAALQLRRPFVDVTPGHWAFDAVDRLSARLYVEGTGGERFEPDRAVTRAEFAAMLARALKLQPTSARPPFEDVSDEAWYAEPLSAAYSAGIVSGRGDGRFEPSARVSRQELAVMAMRAYRHLNGSDSAAAAVPFADESQIAEWAAEDVREARALQLVRGRSGGRFAPEEGATRAEAAQLLDNMLKRLASEKLQ